ncbi:MAG TPA: tetratricopeptide repeat protein, partial [Methylophaga sp.]|nr:tetratricopeptide repeat protein [Methylophaga sp.]
QLASLAQIGDGIYQTISSDDGDIQNLIANSNAAVTEQTMEDSKHLVEQWAEQGPWLLLLLLPLAALYFRKGLLIVPVIVLMNYPQDSYAFEWQDLWKTPDQQGQQAFDHQQYEQAAAKFKSPDWQAAAQYKAEKYQQAAETLQPLQQPTADVYYNRATALAKAGQLQPALDVYNKALKLNPKHEDALYNKKLVEQALEKQKQDKKQDQDKKKSDEEKQNEQDKQTESNQASQPEKEADDKQAQQQSAQNPDKSDEQKQAQEQWLKRIPDDPAGLLKRKFKYQYSQRNRGSQQE